MCASPSLPGITGLSHHHDPACPKDSESREVSSTDLLGESNVLIITHNGQRYQLRRTRQNKLILTR
uniref:hemin uptake protein HemP n=1 Tax=Halomonas sp. TaxID=1486246 RepID=UPI0026154E85|nr:hemin uptake protein HemP [Halomonas sp.]